MSYKPTEFDHEWWYSRGVQAARNGGIDSYHINDPHRWAYEEHRLACKTGYKEERLKLLLEK